jgi:hypothetical protein
VTSVVKHIKDETDKDLLGVKKQKWTGSVGVVGHPLPDSLTKSLFEIRTGLADATITKSVPHEVYVGTDTRDVYHTGWNVSTELVGHRDQERFLQAT